MTSLDFFFFKLTFFLSFFPFCAFADENQRLFWHSYVEIFPLTTKELPQEGMVETVNCHGWRGLCLCVCFTLTICVIYGISNPWGEDLHY